MMQGNPNERPRPCPCRPCRLSRHPALATRDPKAIQLHSCPTPNGVKVSIALEELGLPYDAPLVHIGRDDQHSPESRSLNPAIIDADGPGGRPLPLFEGGAILIHLAERAGRLMGEGRAAVWKCCSG